MVKVSKLAALRKKIMQQQGGTTIAAGHISTVPDLIKARGGSSGLTDATLNNAYRSIHVAAPSTSLGKLGARIGDGCIAGGELQPDENQGGK